MRRVPWPEVLCEAGLLAAFMLSASCFGVLLEHPTSALGRLLPDALLRRLLMGLAMGLTAVLLIYSAPGRRSGAHLNPAVTLTFLRLGKVRRWQAVLYVGAQFAGGLLGMALAALLLQDRLADPHVRYVVTVPGRAGPAAAFLAELVISFVLMSVVLATSNHARLARHTGIFAGLLVATYITLEAPLSGMSMNPARTLGSAAWARTWAGWWIYFTAPLLGMGLAARLYTRRGAGHRVRCAKLVHDDRVRCIFCGANP